MYTPRTISSSVRRAQSSASRLVRKVFAVVGHPVLRMTAFQVPEGVFTRLAMAVPLMRLLTTVLKLYRRTNRLSAGTSQWSLQWRRVLHISLFLKRYLIRFQRLEWWAQ